MCIQHITQDDQLLLQCTWVWCTAVVQSPPYSTATTHNQVLVMESVKEEALEKWSVKVKNLDTSNYYKGIISLNCFKLCPVTTNTDVTPCKHGAIRLQEGNSLYEGRVEVCFEDHWATICYHQWNKEDAVVACRQLGHSGGKYNCIFDHLSNSIHIFLSFLKPSVNFPTF